MKTIIGLTGPTGAGKSTASAVASQLDITVLDCDKICKSVYDTDPACVLALENAFGSEIINGGKIDRKALARLAFADEQSTKKLNSTVLPFIVSAVMQKIENAKTNIVLLDAPTLYEGGLESICKAVIAVLGEKDIRLKRIMSRDNISLAAAESRINAGKPDNFYLERANFILYNNGDEQTLKADFQNILNQIVKE